MSSVNNNKNIKGLIFLPATVNDYRDMRLTGNIKKDTAFFRNIFKNDDIFKIRTVTPKECKAEFSVMFFDGMIDTAGLCMRKGAFCKRSIVL